MQENLNVPLVAHEADMSRMERTIKRLWLGLLIAMAIIAVSNIAWIVYLSQYDFEGYEVSADNDGTANYIGNDGDIYNGSESFGAKEKVEEQSAS